GPTTAPRSITSACSSAWTTTTRAASSRAANRPTARRWATRTGLPSSTARGSTRARSARRDGCRPAGVLTGDGGALPREDARIEVRVLRLARGELEGERGARRIDRGDRAAHGREGRPLVVGHLAAAHLDSELAPDRAQVHVDRRRAHPGVEIAQDVRAGRVVARLERAFEIPAHGVVSAR